MSTRPYVVRQGDYLGALAQRFGFSVDEVWDDPSNAALRQRRPSHDLLAPGDLLHLPVRAPPGQELCPHRTNRYRAHLRRVTVVLVLRDADGPLASQRYVVEGAPARIEGTSDASGRIAFEVPTTVREVQLSLPERGAVYPVRVGHLDPVEERSGVAQRLAQRGYVSPRLASGDEARRVAIENFQRDQGLPITGEADADTRSRLGV